MTLSRRGPCWILFSFTLEEVYAIQAGREVRVFVQPKMIDDFGAYRLARDIAKKIESELKYPGEIRVVEYAR